MGIPTQSLVSKNDITKYIPQAPPILMVDELIYLDDTKSTTLFEIEKDNIFCKDNCLDECGIIEHIAQSAALRAGYISMQNGLDVSLGFIGSVNKFKLHNKANIGDTLKTELVIVQTFMNITLISAKVYTKELLVAECTMKIAMEN